MTKPNFYLAVIFGCTLWTSVAFAAEDSDFKEAQDAVLKSLDLPLGIGGKHTIHIRLKSKGGVVTNEFWNPKLHMRLNEGAALSAADKLNGEEQALLQGEVLVTADAQREILNAVPVGQSELKYQRWKEVPSTFGKDGFLGFSLLKTVHGWKINEAKRGAKMSSDPPYHKVISLSTEPTEKPVSFCSEEEVETAFRQLIHSQTKDGFILVERTLPAFSDYTNVDRHHEFHAPSLQFEILPPTTPQALNNDAIACVRVLCQAHRFPKTAKSRTVKSPESLPQEINLWKGEDPGLKWRPPSNPNEKGDCDFIGVRRDGKWIFTISGFLLNAEWLEKVVLIPKDDIPKPEDELTENGRNAKRPPLVGIGVTLAVKGRAVEITSVYPGSPAEQSGQIHVGDKIVAIGHPDPPTNWGRIDITEPAPQHLRDSQLNEVVMEMRGVAGAAVNLRIQPVGSNDPSQIKEVKIIRAEIKGK